MEYRRLHRPIAAAIALVCLGGFGVLACGDDDDNGGTSGNTDGGTTTKNDSGATTESDAGDGGSDDYTVDIVAGYATACALSQKGRVKCWGDAVDGELVTPPLQGKTCFNINSKDTPPTPAECDPRTATEITFPYPVEQIAATNISFCAIANDNGTRRLGCWGSPDDSMTLSSYGPDAGPATSIVWIPLPAQPKRIRGGKYFKLIELEDGTLWGWGDNSYGHYGAPVLDVIPTPTKVWPVPGVDAGPITEVATGRINSLVLTPSGLWGTGDNSVYQGQMTEPEELHGWTQLPTARNGSDAGPIDAGGDPIAKLFKTNGATEGLCYITASGKAYCWSDNYYTQNGAAVNESVDPVLTPTLIDLPPERKAVDIAIASGGICARTDDGSVYCWGDNRHGAAGYNTDGDRYVVTPKKVQGVENATAIAVGTHYFACAVTAEHKTLCWGSNSFGQRGAIPDGGATQFSPTPSEVPLTW